MSDQAFVRGSSGRPTPPQFIPKRVVERFPGAMWVPLSYQHPSRSWRIEDGTSRTALAYLKISPVGVSAGIAAERQRLTWADGKLPVPALLDAGDDNGMEWIVLDPLPGIDGTDPRLLRRPEQLVRMLAGALRRLHAVPLGGCPFDFRLAAAMAHVESRLRWGQIDPSDFKQEFARYSAEAAVAQLRRDVPAIEDLVITHGDYCVPNIVFDGDRLSGFVDLGELGIADRWRDLAVATWSLEWNIGPGWQELFLQTYGVEDDPGRMRFYRLLYELAS